MKILITGGMGFVGTAIVRRLALFHDIIVADRLDFGIDRKVKKLIDQKKLILRHNDLCEDSEIHREIADGVFDMIIHLAAMHYIPACEKNPIRAYHDNVISSLLILKNIPKNGRLVNFSTAAVYKSEDIPHCEDRSIIFPCDVYGWTKRHVETLAQYYAEKKGFSVINIRLFNAVGSGETNPHILPAIISQIQKGVTTIELGNLYPKRDFIAIDDIAWVVGRLINQWPADFGRLESFNVGSGNPISMEELLKKVVQSSGKDVHFKSVASRCRSSERALLCANLAKLKAVLPDFHPMDSDQWISMLVSKPALRIDMQAANQ